ncbi:hypothetical protein Afil01_43170 [Actinorhabdospora filicis]|uniref:RADC family protein n=1 Tax=Actinorhabdospora filicis TaxID=1785913 RepID=A0A9W6SM82_9ACTN|nr:hypothetical protein [Actinorhabdospora filicis]GLZ79510.1 hypothetical protein Afil01_43170 [Actinorhabdospora filicis]
MTYYFGSGPYCYSNSFAMMMGEHAPATAVLETLTGSPFGMQYLGGGIDTFFFDPYAWDPAEGFANVLAATGWTSETASGGDAEAALDRLRAALAYGPVWIGPVEMGHLRHQPGMTGPIGADHYVVVLEADDETVLMHDPQGHPYVAMPTTPFMRAWAKETVGYGEPYSMRWGFTRVEEVDEVTALHRGLPEAATWLAGKDLPAPPGSLANGDAAEALAALADDGLKPGLRGHLAHFAVRVGARRLDDGARSLRRAGHETAAAVMTRQARLVGGLQYPVIAKDDAAVARGLRELATTYPELSAALATSFGS